MPGPVWPGQLGREENREIIFASKQTCFSAFFFFFFPASFLTFQMKTKKLPVSVGQSWLLLQQYSAYINNAFPFHRFYTHAVPGF